MDTRDEIQALKEELSFRNIFKIICWHQSNIAAEYINNRVIKQITYAEYEKMIKSAAYQIAHEIGVEYQNRFVGLKLDNCPQWPVVFWGILMAGYKPLLLDFRFNEKITGYLLSEAGAAAIISSEKDNLVLDIKNITSESLGRKEVQIPDDWEFSWADEMALCTSGTTAFSRVYVYNGSAIGHNLLNQDALRKANINFMPEGEARCLAFVPYHHVYGFMVTYLPSSVIGKTIIYLNDRAPSTILQACQIHRVTHIYSIPLLWNNLSSAILREVEQTSRTKQILFNTMCKFSLSLQKRIPERSKKMVSVMFAGLQKQLLGQSIILLGCGGGSVLPQSLKVLNAIGYNLICGYGMTETGITSIEARNDIEKKLTASLGHPLYLTEYKIMPVEGINDPDEGELYIKGPSLHSAQMVKGVREPALTDEDGWFATGDIAIIKDGTMWLKGRLKEVIINESGENVYPDELEDLFGYLKGVEQICILGIRNSGLYEDITLVVYSGNDNNDEWQKQIMREILKINNRLPVYMRLSRALLSAIPLPISNNMKVQRLKLKEQIEQNKWAYQSLDITHPEDISLHAISADQNLFEPEELVASDINTIRTELKACLADVMHISPAVISTDSHFIDDLGGDSLSSLELLVKLEEKYSISIPDEEYSQCNNVNEFSSLVCGILQKKDNNDS